MPSHILEGGESVLVLFDIAQNIAIQLRIGNGGTSPIARGSRV